MNLFNQKCLEDTRVRYKVAKLFNGTINAEDDFLPSKLLLIEGLNQDEASFLISNGLDRK